MGPTSTTIGGAVDIVCSRFVEQEWFTLVCGTSLARIGLFLGRKNICRAVVITSGNVAYDRRFEPIKPVLARMGVPADRVSPHRNADRSTSSGGG